MTESRASRPRLGGLLTAQFFGAFNDNAMKLMVALLAGGVAADLVTGSAAKQMARQETTMIAFVVFTLPLMLFSLPSALLADRFSKRSIILAMKAAEVFIMAAGAAVLAWQPNGGFALMILLGLMGLQSAVFSPAKYGIMPELCDETTITKGNGLLELWTFLAIIGGYALGGGLLKGAGATPWLAMAALTALSLVGLVAAFWVPKVPAAAGREPLLAPLRGGWRAIREHRGLKLVIVGQTLFWGLASLLSQDVLVYATEVIGVEDDIAGVPFAAFGIGIGIGSVLAGRISNHRIEAGLIPIGAIGLALGTTLMGVWTPMFWGTMGVMTLLGVASGLLIVPLEAMLQWYSPADRRGAVIAIANVPVFFGVMLGSLVVYFLALSGYEAEHILTVAGLVTVGATLWALWLLPQALARMIVVILTHTFYRLRVFGIENVPKEGGALIVVNHVSLVDGLFLISSLDRPVRFLVDTAYFNKWWVKPFMKALGALQISAGSQKEMLRAMKGAGDYLDRGELVCIFAEGEITRTGALLPFRRGLTRILKGHDVPVIPAHLDQVWGSPFSSKGGGFLRSFEGPVPRPITLSFGAPLPPTTPVEEIRDHVRILDAKAWRIRQESRPPLHHTLARRCRSGRFRHAVSDTTGKRLSRIGLLAGSVLLARKLRESWGPQENVGILLPPSVGCALTNIGAAFSGRVAVNLNYTMGSAGLVSSVGQAGLRTVVTTREFLEKAGLELPDGVAPIWLEDVMSRVTARERLGAMLRAMFSSVRSLERYAGAIRIPQVDDVVTIIFSSGSTGEPKGVLLTHSNIDANSESVAQVLGLRGNEKLLGILPQFHSFGFMGQWFALNHGVAVACHSNPLDAATIGPLVERERVTILIATPTFLQVYMRRCSPGQFGSLRLVITGAEKLLPAVADEFEDRFGVRPLEGYGTSECSPVVAVNLMPYRAPGFFQQGGRRGSIGQPIPGVAVRIVDPDTFAPVPSRRPGMLLVSGPNVMRGYLGREDLTAEVLRDGWYVTGDIAEVDEDGFVRITDRLSRFSKIGGEMVPHGKVEEILHEVAGLSDRRAFCVTGIPDPKKGEQLAVLHTVEEASLVGILGAMSERGLPNLFVPRRDRFVHVEEIPVLGTGKVDLRRVKQIAVEAFGVPT